jgi:hypothetical protein
MSPLSTTEFLRRLPGVVRPLLPEPLRGFQLRTRGWLIQFWYGNDPRIHYEVWVHGGRSLLELGLHCEADAARNEWLRRRLLLRLFELKAELGNAVEVEEWDKGWSRLYETHPLNPVDEARLDDFAARVAHFIAVVQPVLDEISAEG